MGQKRFLKFKKMRKSDTDIDFVMMYKLPNNFKS